MSGPYNGTRRRFLKYSGAVAIAGMAGCLGGGNGGEYPNRSIEVIVPWAQGGGTDRATRATVGPWGEIIGSNFTVQNLDGASTQIGGEELYDSEPDGYTVAMWNLPQMQATWMFQDAPYDMDSFDYFGTHHLDPTMWFAPPDSPYGDMVEFLEYAEDNDVTIGTTAAIGNTALSALLVNDTYDLNANIVNLEGGSPTRESTLAGDVDASVNQPWAFNPDHQGDVVALGTHTPEPVDEELWADAPAFGELGLGDELPLVDEGFGQWKIMVAPGGLEDEHPDRFETLEETYLEAMESDEFLDAAEDDARLDLILDVGGADKCRQEVEDYTGFMEEHGGLIEEFHEG